MRFLLGACAMTIDRHIDRPVDEHMRFQRAEWVAERVAWGAMALVAFVALTGLLGYGPASWATASDSSGRLSVEYNRFQRATVTTRFAFHVTSPQEPVELRLGPAFSAQFEIDSLHPEPVRSTQGPDGLHMAFARPPTGDLTVVLWCRPRRFGRLDLSVALGAQAPIQRMILVYP
jgi:hypothetical protein